jgi:23S rRNA pseudouridine2605 synthase
VKVAHPSRRIGLARALSKLGYCSRSKAFGLIRGGQVRLNGNLTRNPESPVHIGRDRIEVDGISVQAGTLIYFMMNKPRGVVTTASDEKGRETVYRYLEKDTPWVGPVGRLDKASEGLLLLTNDSEWAAKITAPETHLGKTYHVQIGIQAQEKMLESLEKGVRTKTGEVFRVKSARKLRGGEKNTWIEVTLDEGKNRQIRRIFEALGIEVLRLVRVAIGNIVLGELAKGKVRRLTPEQKTGLDRLLETAEAQASRPSRQAWTPASRLERS